MGLVPLQETPEGPLFSLSQDTVKKASMNLQVGPQQNTKWVGALLSYFTASRAIRNKYVCCLRNPVCNSFVTAARMV